VFNGIEFNVARAVGPALGGFLVGVMGVGSVIALNALSFLVTICLVRSWAPSSQRRTTPTEHLGEATIAAIRYIRHPRAVRDLPERRQEVVVTDQNNSMLEQTNQHPEGFVQPSASTETRPPLPPFTADTAVLKVRLAEDGWKSRDPERVSLAYAPNSRWRNRAEFVNGRQEIVAFLTRKWARELDYRLIKELWAFEGNRIAVRFAYEWHDDSFNWFR
jgi:hypothetical protein